MIQVETLETRINPDLSKYVDLSCLMRYSKNPVIISETKLSKIKE
nr:hypothetical protein [Mycoplasmopsis bovis]